MTERSFDALHVAVDAVHDATDLQGALDRIVTTLPLDHELWMANIARFISKDAIRILAAWSTGDTVFEAGTILSVHYTEESSMTAATLQRGYPVVVRASDVDFGIISSIFEQEGVAALALIPLHAGETVGALISLGSASPDGLDVADIPLLTGLGRGVEKHIMELITQAEKDEHPASASEGDTP